MSNFFSKYKLLLLLVFVFSFCIPTNVFALNYCFYFEGSRISDKCMDNLKEIDCPQNYQIDRDGIIYTVYPKNLVGAYKTTKSDCITPDKNYYLEGKQLLPNNPLELQFEAFLLTGENKMKDTTAGQTFKKDLIKTQLNFIIENTCCVPTESSKNDPRFACGKPTIRYTDEEILNLKVEDFLNSNLLKAENEIKYIDKESSFWNHVRCDTSGGNNENNWEHWSVSCNNSAPIVPNTKIGINSRDDLSRKKTEEVELRSGAGAKIFNSDFCASTKGDFCICKTGGKDCNNTGFKSIQTCEQGLENMSDKNNYGCFEHGENNVDCHPQTPIITPTVTENKLTTPSGFSGLNKLGETDIQKLIGRFIRIVIGVIGTIALLMFVYGGLLWMTSAGNAEKTKKAMDIILWSSLGVIVILASYAIVNFVFGLL